MFRWLGNVGVNRKLGFGFGLVLFLTVMIAFIGWAGLEKVTARGDTLGLIASLNDLTKDLRSARMDYDATRGEKGPGDLNDLLGKLEPGLQSVRQSISEPADVAIIDKQLAAIAEYRTAVAELIRATASREDARSKLGASADNAVTHVADVENVMLQGDSVPAFGRVATLAKALQHARYQVRGYTYSGQASAEQPALDAIDNAMKTLDSLAPQLSDEHAAKLQQASESFKAYRAAVSQFRDAQTANAAAIKRMSDLGIVLRKASADLTASQTLVRDHQVAQADTLLISAAALALLFGLIAAWVITRQIVDPLDQTLKVAEHVAAGDLTHNLTSERRDELGQLQRAMQGGN
jgi:methyl-accepting chemotaxis protein